MTLPISSPENPPLKFFVQRGGVMAEEEVGHGVRRLQHRSATELQIALPGADERTFLVAYYLTIADSHRLIISFEAAFQPLRRLLYGPADQRSRDRVWRLVSEQRPLFMAVNWNGLNFNTADVGLMQCTDAADGSDKNLVVFSPDGLSTDWSAPLDDDQLSALAILLQVGLGLLDETSEALDPGLFNRYAEYGDLGTPAKGAVKWLFENAGNIKDAIELARMLTE